MPPLGIDEKGKLDDGTLRRFVFQTYGRARRTQDSPVMPDVWLRYIRIAEKVAALNIARRTRLDEAAALPDDVVDLLLTPSSGTRPGKIAAQLRASLNSIDVDTGTHQSASARIALSDSRVVVCANFKTLICHIVPLSGWWKELFRDDRQFEDDFERIAIDPKKPKRPRGKDAEFARYVALVGFIEHLLHADSTETIERLAELAYRLGPSVHEPDDGVTETADLTVTDVPLLVKIYDIARELLWHAVPPPVDESADEPTGEPGGIFLISLNRPAVQSLSESRATIKADAAQRVFEIDTTGIAFAVIDGGIDATHPAFLNRSRKEVKALGDKQLAPSDYLKYSRVRETYDFTILRDLIDFAISRPAAQAGEPGTVLATQIEDKDDTTARKIKRLYNDSKHKTAFEHLAIRHSIENGRDLDWEIVRPLITVPHVRIGGDEADEAGKGDEPYAIPETDHGTHVAGILAAGLPKRNDFEKELFGICPHLTLYDLRVFDDRGHGDEFAILCALEFVGWLNRDRTMPVVHGVNLSLALAHDVDSFACGQTPICEVCNHLVGAGTVVVAAAGNTGFENGASAEKKSIGTGYRPISITDPGNADYVITVGSTHRRDPHLYGVSYFSARGPTGDGRRKPDLLAPGEKITSTIPRGGSQRMDGTSMAAPHVAGAAALLMARYPELIGRPVRIKEILMATATDLKREPNFQGAGLVDVLRALQSV